MTKKRTTDYFIKFFSAIPRNKWSMGEYSDGRGAHCAFGHLQKHNLIESYEDWEEISPVKCIVSVNDGVRQYLKLGKHPKTRVVNWLKSIKKSGRKVA